MWLRPFDHWEDGAALLTFVVLASIACLILLLSIQVMELVNYLNLPG